MGKCSLLEGELTSSTRFCQLSLHISHPSFICVDGWRWPFIKHKEDSFGREQTRIGADMPWSIREEWARRKSLVASELLISENFSSIFQPAFDGRKIHLLAPHCSGLFIRFIGRNCSPKISK